MGSSKKKRENKEKMGYQKPAITARCRNCVRYDPGVQGMPATELQAAINYVPSHCKKGNFAVHPDGMCNEFELRRVPLDRPSLNPGLLDSIPIRPTAPPSRIVRESGHLPRLAAEWGNN